MTTTTTTTTAPRVALVRGNEDPHRVDAYLPDNYATVRAPDRLLIVGIDVAGWTLEGYVIPRLASGLIFAHEIHACQPDTELVDRLTQFVRTPEWSVSMLEDIAEEIHRVRPGLTDYESMEHPDAWHAH